MRKRAIFLPPVYAKVQRHAAVMALQLLPARWTLFHLNRKGPFPKNLSAPSSFCSPRPFFTWHDNLSDYFDLAGGCRCSVTNCCSSILFPSPEFNKGERLPYEVSYCCVAENISGVKVSQNMHPPTRTLMVEVGGWEKGRGGGFHSEGWRETELMLFGKRCRKFAI